MKNIITILLLTVFFNKLYGQPTSEIIDVNEGSNIELIEIYKKNKKLYLYNWNKTTSNNNRIYNLKKISKTDTILLDMLFFKRSEMDSTYKKHVLIYKKDTMTLKVKKNFAGLKIKIKTLNFKKGTYFIDLKDFFNKYGDQKKYKKHSVKEVVLDKFPKRCKD